MTAQQPSAPRATPEGVRVLIVDDQELVREGIASLLGLRPGIRVVGTAADGRQAVEAAVEHRPDVILMDVRMPVMDGVEATAILARRAPWSRVVMLTTFDDDAYVSQALRAGAVGYLLKNLPSAELAAAVELAYAGVAQVDAAIARRLTVLPAQGTSPGSSRETAPTAPPTALPPAAGALTDRETDILRLIATGSTNREIAARLYLSEGTVKNHISRILTRLGLRDRTHAAIYAHHHGIL